MSHLEKEEGLSREKKKKKLIVASQIRYEQDLKGKNMIILDYHNELS